MNKRVIRSNNWFPGQCSEYVGGTSYNFFLVLSLLSINLKGQWRQDRGKVHWALGWECSLGACNEKIPLAKALSMNNEHITGTKILTLIRIFGTRHDGNNYLGTRLTESPMRRFETRLLTRVSRTLRYSNNRSLFLFNTDSLTKNNGSLVLGKHSKMWILAKFRNKNVNFMIKNNGHQSFT